MKPEEYNARLEAILTSLFGSEALGRGNALPWDTPFEGGLHLVRISRAQKELRVLNREIAATVKGIRSRFSADKAAVRAGLFAAVEGSRAAGRDCALKRKMLRLQEEATIGPYEELQHSIDSVLVQLDRLKLEIDMRLTDPASGGHSLGP